MNQPTALPPSEGEILVSQGHSACDALAAVTERTESIPSARTDAGAPIPEGMRKNSAGEIVAAFRLPTNS